MELVTATHFRNYFLDLVEQKLGQTRSWKELHHWHENISRLLGITHSMPGSVSSETQSLIQIASRYTYWRLKASTPSLSEERVRNSEEQAVKALLELMHA